MLHMREFNLCIYQDKHLDGSLNQDRLDIYLGSTYYIAGKYGVVNEPFLMLHIASITEGQALIPFTKFNRRATSETLMEGCLVHFGGYYVKVDYHPGRNPHNTTPIRKLAVRIYRKDYAGIEYQRMRFSVNSGGFQLTMSKTNKAVTTRVITTIGGALHDRFGVGR